MEHKCPRCEESMPISEEYWHRKTKSVTGFDLTMCKACRNKYQKSRRNGTWQKRATKPKIRKRPVSSFKLSCMRYRVKLALEPTTSIFEDVLAPSKARTPVKGL